MELVSAVCESCGRAPARTITVRRHVGLLVMQRFVSIRATACRPCGRALVRSFTGKTLWQGWWGPISFFFNWFVLASNAFAARRLGSIAAPSLSGEYVPPPAAREFGNPAEPASTPDAPKRSRLRTVATFVLPGFFALGLAGWAWDATHHDHGGAHGAPAPAEAISLAMSDGDAFIADDGTSVTVQSASCAGEGTAVAGGSTHFKCQLTFVDGTNDEVIVHLLPNDELLFKSSGGSG